MLLAVERAKPTYQMVLFIWADWLGGGLQIEVDENREFTKYLVVPKDSPYGISLFYEHATSAIEMMRYEGFKICPATEVYLMLSERLEAFLSP